MELELWTIAVEIPCLHVICILLALNLCMLCWNYTRCSGPVPEWSPLGRILRDWENYCSKSTYKNPLSKQLLIYYCNTVWPTYVLSDEMRWPVNGSLSYCIIMRLKQYCRRRELSEELHYLNAFIILHNSLMPETEKRVMVQKEKVVSKPLPDSRTQEEKDNEEINLINALNPGNEPSPGGGTSVVLLPSPGVGPAAAPSPLQVTEVSSTGPRPLRVAGASTELPFSQVGEAGEAPFPLPAGGAGAASRWTSLLASLSPWTRAAGGGALLFPRAGGTSVVPHPLQTGGASAALPPPQSVEVFTPLASQVIGTASAVVPSPPQAGATSVLSPPITDPEVGTAKPTVPSPCVEEYLSPPRTCQGTLYNQRTSKGVASQYPLRQYPIGGVNEEGQPAGYYWAHTPFSTSDLLNWKNFNPSYRDDPQKVADLVASIFATHHPNWADVQALLNILLTADERRLVLNRANQEAPR